MNDVRDLIAVVTVVASGLVVAWLGLDAWILAVWALSLGVGIVLWLLARLLVHEMRGPEARRAGTHRGAWVAGGIAAFVSCTMAAALVRSQAPARDFWVLGLLMLLAVVDLRLAYQGPRRTRARVQQA